MEIGAKVLGSLNKLSPETLAAVAKSNLPRELGPDALDPVTGHHVEHVPGEDYTTASTTPRTVTRGRNCRGANDESLMTNV